ncbi:MAG: SGNH/GDSL hydrolase family protein [Lentisphaeria bacterium]|nr:SGNH/GDSL hydrolase family protein [Lentisphaeria bacterium]
MRTCSETACCVALTVMAGAAGASGAPPEVAPRDAVEYTVRGGLPNVAARLRADGAVAIGYLGGSITAQPGWRVLTLEWFRGQFPGAAVTEIHAAIGGTGSDLGVFRLRQDVLRHHPDLLFVEFAVNDGGAPPERITKAMEGIVRQTWRANPETDICFVYTLTEGMLGDLQNGKYPRAAGVMEAVADAYAIPSVHMGLRVAQLAQQGKVVFRDPKDPGREARLEAMAAGVHHFSSDGVHPYTDTGHGLYLDAVVRAMGTFLSHGTAGPHPLPTPLRADNWENATMVPFGRATLGPGWRRLDPAADDLAKRFAQRLPELWLAEEPGTRAGFRFRGTLAKVYDLVGPRCGSVVVRVDGVDRGRRDRFDAYCTYDRLQTMEIASELPDGLHTVELEIAPEPPDKRAILQRREGPNRAVLALDEAAFAERFEGTQWAAGMIMLLGTLEEP